MQTRKLELGAQYQTKDIIEKLKHLKGFKVKNQTNNGFSAKVGQSWKYRIVGVYITDNYLAPISIDEHRTPSGKFEIVLSQNGIFAGNFGSRNVEFYEKSYDRIVDAIKH
ncbi:hypothetical protein ACEN19_07325 [Corynebacterium auriscanis]|uniref:hypothetical protein n=1 Tax=Corynebacterium auriscanis TaxID=99807 RepID=UPI003CECE3C9